MADDIEIRRCLPQRPGDIVTADAFGPLAGGLPDALGPGRWVVTFCESIPTPVRDADAPPRDRETVVRLRAATRFEARLAEAWEQGLTLDAMPLEAIGAARPVRLADDLADSWALRGGTFLNGPLAERWPEGVPHLALGRRVEAEAPLRLDRQDWHWVIVRPERAAALWAARPPA